MPYWSVARLEVHREALAQRCLTLAGFQTYLPRLRVVRRRVGRKVEARPPLFPGYCFLVIDLQWHAARRTMGVVGLIMDARAPARVPDSVVDEIRARERNGLVELPSRPAFQRGDSVRIVRGDLAGRLGLYEGQRASERAAILLGVLGRVVLPAANIEPVEE
jgi:transcriptional antiterminator RfaH